MIQDRLNDKEHDIQGVQKQSSELLSIDWQKGYQAGFNDGYDTRREADQRLQGEWIVIHNALGETKYKCDQCQHYVKPSDDKNFCPNCGAKMKGGAEDD